MIYDPSLDYPQSPSCESMQHNDINSRLVPVPKNKNRYLYKSELPIVFAKSLRKDTIKGEQIIAGRSKQCLLPLTSYTASPCHAMFEYQDGDWYLSDLHSTNGTFLNGSRLEPGKRYCLCVNDEIRFADESIILSTYERQIPIPVIPPVFDPPDVFVSDIRRHRLPGLIVQYSRNLDTRLLGDDDDSLILTHPNGQSLTVEHGDVESLNGTIVCDIYLDTSPEPTLHAAFYHKMSSDPFQDFSLDQQNTDWLLADRGSTNGTYLNGRRLTPEKKYPLLAGDIICFGRENWFSFGKLPAAVPAEEPTQLVSDILKTKTIYLDDRFPVYHCREQHVRTYSGKHILAGQDPMCALQLTSASTSGVHAMFEYDEGFWYLSDCKSANGTFINGFRLVPQRKYILSYNDTVSFAGETIIFYPPQQVLQEEPLPPNAQSVGLQAGSIIDSKYRIVKKLSADIIAKTYLLEDLRLLVLQKKWVGKVVDKKDPKYAPVKRQVLIDSVKMLMGLQHPAMNTIVDFIEDEQYVIAVWEYIQGDDLLSILREQGPFSSNTVIDIGIQMCDVLGYLHGQNPPLIHRDIKPSNIMRLSDGRLKLIDFDIMLCCEPEQMKNALILGTRGYAAPEQHYTTTELTPATDIYALGVTLYQLLTGNDPVFNPNILPIRQLDPTLPKKLERIITKCTEKDFKMRYRNCAELRADLEKAKNSKLGFSSWFSR